MGNSGCIWLLGNEALVFSRDSFFFRKPDVARLRCDVLPDQHSESLDCFAIFKVHYDALIREFVLLIVLRHSEPFRIWIGSTVCPLEEKSFHLSVIEAEQAEVEISV